MRFLLVIDRFGSGGAQTQLAMMCRGLVSRGHQVSVFTYQENAFLGAAEYLADCSLIEYRKSTRSGVDVVARLCTELRHNIFDVAVAFLTGPNVYLSLARRLARFDGVVLVGERSSFANGHPRFKDRLHRWGHRHADLVVANSVSQARALKTFFPRLAAKVHTVLNAVDLSRYFPADESPPETQRSILCVGRIVPEKNVLGMIKALRHLHDWGVHANVVWVGRWFDKEFLRICTEALAAEGLANHWQWAGETTDVRLHYTNATVFALVSFFEGTPNVVCEALACGVPVVASDIEQVRWLVDGMKNGRLVDPADSRAIANGLREILTLPTTELAGIRRHARQFAERHLSEERMVSEYLRLVQEAFARKGRVAAKL